ncbi:MAG: T9SS type A sorting domain-containing protein, partial [Psychroflexus sp.]
AEPIEIYDFVYENGNWLPNEPNGNEAQNSSIYIDDDNFSINNELIFGELHIPEFATVNVESTLTVIDKMNIKGELIFESNENQIGQIGELSSGVEINGEVTVERYIPEKRSFRFVTSGVNSTESIFENWQENGESPNGFGTHITGSTEGNNGFDNTETGNPSMFGFENSTQNWYSVADTDQTNLEAGKPYRLYIRGDRNIDLNSNVSESSTVLRAKGSLETGDKIFDNLGENAGDFNLIGNPYQAIVDLNEVNFNNLNTNFVWVWDPNMNENGAYVVVDISDGSSTGSSLANEFLQPGQSVFFETLNDGAASLTFTENSKNVNQINNEVFSEIDLAKIDIQLFEIEHLGDYSTEIDALRINFNANANNEVDFNDAKKLSNPGENLARLNNNDFLSLENRSIPTSETELDLAIYNFQNENYTLTLEIENFETHNVFLNDRYTGEAIILNDEINHFSFDVNPNIPESSAMDRFYLKLENTTLSIKDENFETGFTVYPNPVINDQFTIQSKIKHLDSAGVKLYNLYGQVVFSVKSNFSSDRIQIQTEKFASGIYFVEIEHENHSFKKKIIVE